MEAIQEEHKQTLLAEELLACDTDISARIHTAQLVSDDIVSRDRELSLLADQYSDVFKNRDDAMYFAMLPLSEADRKSVLHRARDIMNAEAALKAVYSQSN
tara:strand:- start:10700 stop:11002 length:303 start_codon:yes stop_codon:yes gene_type:complete